MGLTQDKIIRIKNSVKEIFAENSKVFLFGSRIDDRKGAEIFICVY